MGFVALCAACVRACDGGDEELSVCRARACVRGMGGRRGKGVFKDRILLCRMPVIC